MIRKFLFSLMAAMSITTQAQEPIVPDSSLHLPTLNTLGQMHYINRWPALWSGLNDWDLHKGLNVSLGASVFAAFGKHTPSGVGFSQNISGMYALPLTERLSLAVGGYMVNTDWAGFNTRDAGLSGVLGYRFNDHWEGYLYGQKSLIMPQIPIYFYDMQELGDRIGAAIKYNFSPSFSIQLSVEERKAPPLVPYFGHP